MQIFRWLRGSQYVVHLRQHELMEKEMQVEFETAEEIVEEMKTMPKLTKLLTYQLIDAPEFWSAEKFGPWPSGGCRLYGIRFPSANRSWTAEMNKKHPLLLVSTEPSGILELKGEFTVNFEW